MTSTARKRGTATAHGNDNGMYEYGKLKEDRNGFSRSHDTKETGKIHKNKSKGLAGDYKNVALLLLLYTLQGVPLGLSHTMDVILQEKAISFKQQGIFSFVSLPYSVKLLWAPIVDSVYIERIGRRKSWLIPVQTAIGLLMLATSGIIPYLLGETDGSDPHVKTLTSVFFLFYFLAATQDIAVDGWAVTMLQRHNIGWASTCNVVGQTFGYFIAFTGFIGLKMYGIMDLPQFMQFWGIVFLVSTAIVGVLKKEVQSNSEKGVLLSETVEDGDVETEEELSVQDTYKQMLNIIRLKSVKLLIVVLLTAPVAFAATDNLAQRKLMQRGMKKEHVATLMVFITPLSIILPGLLSKYVAERPLSLYRWAYRPRVALSFAATLLVYFAPDFHAEENSESLPLSFFLCLVGFVVVRSVMATAMFVAVMGFFAKISDPKIGGTYMTLLNTLANFGSNIPNQLVLFFVDKVSFSNVDGFYVINSICVVGGIVWFLYFGRLLNELQDLDVNAWHVAFSQKKQNQ